MKGGGQKEEEVEPHEGLSCTLPLKNKQIHKTKQIPPDWAFRLNSEVCVCMGGGGEEEKRSVAAAPAVPAAVRVPRRGLAVFGPPAEDLVGAVVAAAPGHAWRSLVDLESSRERRRNKKMLIQQRYESTKSMKRF